MTLSRKHTLINAAILIVVLVGGWGCAATPPVPEHRALPLVRQDNGLEIRHWTVSDNLALIQSALHSVDATPAMDETISRQFQANGLSLMRVDASRLPELKARLGSVLSDVSEWHGQAPTWRDIQSGVNSGSAAVVVDGQIRTFRRGRIQLMMRGWTSWMEDGPFVHLELAFRHNEHTRTPLREVLRGGLDSPDLLVTSLSLEASLEADQAYVLFMVPAQNDEDSPQPPSRTRNMGPEVTPPPALGELLFFRGGIVTNRTLLVFIPKVSDALFPQGHPVLTKRGYSFEGDPEG